MKHINLDTIALFLLVIGGLNAGIAAVFGYDAIGMVMAGGLSTAFYALVGMSAIYALAAHMGWVAGDA